MNAVTFTAPGDASVLSFGTVAAPAGAAGHVIAEQDYADVNFGDVLYRRYGIYPPRTPPYVVGYGGAGVIRDADGASAFTPGQRVAYFATSGGYAERISVPAAQVVEIPDGIDSETAAALVVAGTAAYEMLATAATPAGGAILVQGGAGGVASFLLQLAHIRGLRSIAVVSSEEKASFARECAASEVVVSADWKGVPADRADAVFDSVGAPAAAASLAALRHGGTLVVYGATSGPAAFDSFTLMQKSLTIRGFALVDHLATWPAAMRALFAHVQAGELRAPVTRVFPLAEAGAAHRLLESRAAFGKVLLSVR